MIALLIFLSTFATVFALGFQSLNVNGGHYRAAFLNSFFIAAGNLAILKLVPDASLIQMAAYMLGGPLGITASMWAHARTIGRKSKAGAPSTQ